MSPRLPKLLAWLIGTIVVLAIFAWLVLFRPVAQPHTNDPIALFNHGSIGNETTQGLPYWIWRVLPRMFPQHLPGNRKGYGAIGVYWERGSELPVGFSKMTLGVVPRVAPNCAFCHQSSYRLAADHKPTLVPGGTGGRVDPQGFIRFLAKVGTDDGFTSSAVMKQIKAIYDMPLWERLLYRFAIIPATQLALKQQATRFAWMDSRPDWGPGRIDPFNPVKFANLKLPDDHTIGNSDMMPVWDLGRELGDPDKVEAVHWDGLITTLHGAALSGAIGDGLTYQAHARTKQTLARIEAFIQVQQPPRSPFSSTSNDPQDPYYVAPDAVARGKALYKTRCAACHERGEPRYRTVIPAVEIGTDRHRIDMWTAEAVARYNVYEKDYDWGFNEFRKTNGYAAVGLAGLWLRGPYLHNGSVPSLRALLMAPEERPKTFYRGWDQIDPENGGFVSTGEDAKRHGRLFDTTKAGNGNGGHLWGTWLNPTEKENLLAYLKTL